MLDKLMIFIPAYNCANYLPLVIEQLKSSWVNEIFSKVLIVENRGTDGTIDVAIKAARGSSGFIEVLQNNENYGLGGSHKIAFNYAKKNAFEWVLVLHGDNQGCLNDFKFLLENKGYQDFDMVLGARFMPQSKLIGYSKFRIIGNIVFNFYYSKLFGKRVYDLGSGLNLFRVSALPDNLEMAPDDLTFNCVFLGLSINEKLRMKFIPISWSEDDQISNVKLLSQSFRMLKIPIFIIWSRFIGVPYDYRALRKIYSAKRII